MLLIHFFVSIDKCDRCVDSKTPHPPNNCFFKDKECHACKEKGHMKGAKRCSKTKCVRKLEKVTLDYNDKSNWESEMIEERQTNINIKVRKVNKKKKNVEMWKQKCIQTVDQM